MSPFRRYVTFAILVTLQVSLTGTVWGQTSKGREGDPPDYFLLPIEKAGCGGFTFAGGSMYLFEYNGRQVHEVSKDNRLISRENVSGSA